MRRRILLIICLLCPLTSIIGQNLSNHERRCMNDKLLDLLLSYENYSSFTESHMKNSFQGLFASSDVLVYCDIISSDKYGELIPVSKYATYLSDTVSVRFVEILNLNKTDYVFENGSYRVTVEFDKSLEYEDSLLTVFTTEDALIGLFHIKMECQYDKDEDRFIIRRIEGEPNDRCTFPLGDFTIVVRNDDRDESLLVDGNPLHFNLFDEAVVHGTSLPRLPQEDEDLIVIPSTISSTNRYSKVRYSYMTKRLRLKTGVSISPFGAYKVESPISFSSRRSSAYEMNVDFGYAFPLASDTKLAVFTGIGLSYSTLSLSVKDIAYSYKMSNYQGIICDREYRLSSVNEGLSFLDVVIPLYLSYEELLNDKIALSVDAGIKLYLNASTYVSPNTVKGTSALVHDGVVLTTTELPKTISQYMIAGNYVRNTYDLAGFGKVGVEYRFKIRQYLFAKLGYLYSLTDSYNSNHNEWFKPTDNIYPFVYSDRSGVDVAVRSFVDCISYRRSAFTFDIGYRMKF